MISSQWQPDHCVPKHTRLITSELLLDDAEISDESLVWFSYEHIALLLHSRFESLWSDDVEFSAETIGRKRNIV